MKLSVIFPAYNEEKRIPKTVRLTSEYLKKQSYDYEILVVNDGSKDRTAEVVKKLEAEIPNLRLIDNEKNKGKGGVVRQGMLEAKGEYRLFSDSDNSTSIDQVEKMWPFFEQGFAAVIGSRDVKGAVLNPPQPWIRKVILGDSFKLIRKFIIGLWNIQDTQCGFKGFTAKATEDIFSKAKIDGFVFDVECLVLAKRLGYKIKEMPVIWVNDLESKVKLKHIIRMFTGMIKLRKDLILGKYNGKK
ncbi:glycosyltransferase family 2 protein [Patescibacteria group bacterium]|nr:glycosyltransferase family 2 protein [Patescibacteria group bacterium]MBU4162444.1 glycosyltransferase family 2 protein [Patescibacteria group bacterium]